MKRMAKLTATEEEMEENVAAERFAQILEGKRGIRRKVYSTHNGDGTRNSCRRNTVIIFSNSFFNKEMVIFGHFYYK